MQARLLQGSESGSGAIAPVPVFFWWMHDADAKSTAFDAWQPPLDGNNFMQETFAAKLSTVRIKVTLIIFRKWA